MRAGWRKGRPSAGVRVPQNSGAGARDPRLSVLRPAFKFNDGQRQRGRFQRIGRLSFLSAEASYNGASPTARYLRGVVVDEVVNAYLYDAAGDWTNVNFHHDALTNTVGLSGHDGKVLQNTRYAAFGTVLSESLNGTFPTNRLKYTGREEDPTARRPKRVAGRHACCALWFYPRALSERSLLSGDTGQTGAIAPMSRPARSDWLRRARGRNCD